MKFRIFTLSFILILFLSYEGVAITNPISIAQIKDGRILMITNEATKAKKITGEYANYMLFYSDPVMIDGDKYYHIHTYPGTDALGLVKATDLKIEPVEPSDFRGNYIVPTSTKVYTTPAGTDLQVKERISAGSTFTVDQAIFIKNREYLHGSFENVTGWILKDEQQEKDIKMQAPIPRTIQPESIITQPTTEEERVEVLSEESVIQPTEQAPTDIPANTPDENITSDAPLVTQPIKQTKDSITVPVTLQQAFQIQMSLSPKPQTSNGPKWFNANEKLVLDKMDTEQLMHDPVNKYQFLKLNQSQGISAESLNQLLVGKGILEGHGATFKAASERYNINEIYLISHAFLETGHGQSALAQGTNIDGKLYYNMYGIGAYDKDALKYGAIYARNVGWDTPEKAIMGGAQFISTAYVTDSQSTLYEMRWNPMNPGRSQYATDISWASANAQYIATFYQQLGLEGGHYKYVYYSK